MYVLTIDTEHAPGSVAVVEVDDTTPDVQETIAVLGSVGDPHDPHGQRHAEDLANDAGWLVSGPWSLTADAWVARVTTTPCSDAAATTGALLCPEHHRGTDPAELVAWGDAVPAGLRIVAAISDGRCPACPRVALACETLHLYGRGVEVGRCSCCGAAWREDSDEWECLDIGRLVPAARLRATLP